MSADRPDWTPQSAESWKYSLAIAKPLADRLAADGDSEAGAGGAGLDALDPAPVVVVSEPDPARPDAWQLDLYFEARPDAALLARVHALIGLAPADADASMPGPGATLERIDDADWVTISQAWLEPIRAGRFYVHTAAYAEGVPADAIVFRIEASRAFGTGHHETTSGCLAMLSELADDGRDFGAIADIGTGTGLLAFAARALWPAARVVATDIDPVAIPVVAENMAANAIPADGIALAVADGTDHPALAGGGFDLVTANILAGPLIALAPDFARIVAPGGMILLAGLLAGQEAAVRAAFVAAGFADARRRLNGDWSILAMERAPIAA